MLICAYPASADGPLPTAHTCERNQIGVASIELSLPRRQWRARPRRRLLVPVDVAELHEKLPLCTHALLQPAHGKPGTHGLVYQLANDMSNEYRDGDDDKRTHAATSFLSI